MLRRCVNSPALKLNAWYPNSVTKQNLLSLPPPVNLNSLARKKIHNKNVVLSRYGDISPEIDHPVFTGKNIFLHECDKNFVAYWLRKRVFPNAESIYLASHPCEPWVLSSAFKNIYLHESYMRYKDRWWSHLDNIQIISDADYTEIFDSLTDEQIKCEDNLKE